MQDGGAKLSDSDRFVIVRTLGAGGMGVVYEAFDRERSSVVALKALRNMGPASLYRFKREFRALADLSHPNLVSLYELFSIGDDWFFTMELVAGKSFLAHVRGDPFEPHDTEVDLTEPTIPPLDKLRAPAPPPTLRPAPADLGRLLPALEQLTHGLAALHAAGKLHRDIKPSNVLVTDAGRVVICDFGLVSEARGDATDDSHHHIVGTVSYMSPEQAAGLALDAASDWYSVGVVLYQALTGELPFRGEPRRVMVEKQMHEPAPPSARASGVPPDLDRLCSGLLRIAPERRPGAAEVLATLGAEPMTPSQVTSRAARFVGREAELSRLREAFAALSLGKPVIVRVHGASGMGKTTLVRQFTSELADEGRALVLSGRSYERESVPYKALDSLIDALSNQLRRLSRSEAERVLPPDVQALVRLFPVLRRVEAIAEAPPSFEVPDPQESRLRASAALRELVRRLAALQPLVLHLDDLQWGDIDSAALIADLVRGPDAAPVLLIVSYRSDDADTSPLLAALFGRGPASVTDADLRDAPLAALSPSECRDLALSLFELEGSKASAEADAIARESRGNPLFVQELVRHVHRAERGREQPLPVALDQALAARFRALPAPARALLEMIAIAGRPIPIAVASQAAALDGEQNAALSLLRAERLVRSPGTRRSDELETFHDRIREAVTQALDEAEQRRCHQRLVVALETVGDADPEALVEHLLGAGERQRAARQAEIAADHAATALAFDRAARLYRLALTAPELEPAAASRIWTKLGDALVNAGRGADAAAAYERALPGANPAAALELRRRMAEQLLRSGHLDAGLTAVREVLAQVGMKLAPTPRRALASLVLGRARIRLRGKSFVERDASELSPAELTRIDACWSVATAVGMTDFIRGADFQTRHLLLSLRAGEPHRIARGLAVETAYSGGSGGPSQRRTDELARRTQTLAARLGSPHLEGLSVTVAGIAAFLQGRWQEARSSCERGEAIFRERCTGVAWELASAQFFGLGALYYLGALSELVERVPGRLREAEERGDLYRATGLRSWRTNVAWLAMDDPDTARFQVQEAIRRWTRHGFHLQHYYEVFSLCQIDLYTGSAELALERMQAAFSELERSMLLRIQNVRVESLYVRARAALALAGPAHAKLAERDARAIARERMPWSAPYAHAIRAALAWQAENPDAAARELEAAITGFEAADMALFAAASRQRLGAVIGGARGAALASEAERWMSAQRIARPERMAKMLISGF